jgi:beta-glucanase (GH16 family)
MIYSLSIGNSNVWARIVFLNLVFSLFCEVVLGSAQTSCRHNKSILIEDGRCDPSPYILSFEDNFDGNFLDTGKWTKISGVVRHVARDITQQWYSKSNVEVSNGTLKLHLRRDTLLNMPYAGPAEMMTTGDFYFTCGEIDSRQKFSHGLYEISCRIPRAKGAGASYWMYGDPGMNEVDVFEFENETNWIGQVDEGLCARVHNMNCRADYNADHHMEDCPSHYTGRDFSDGFHVFSLLWTPHKLEWFVDGESVRVTYLFHDLFGHDVDCNSLKKGFEYVRNRAFPHSPMQIILDGIIQTKDNAPDKSTPFPQVYEVDYVRWWEKK